MRLKITKNNRVWVDNPELARRPALCKPHEDGTEDQLDDILRFVHFFADPEDSPLSMERDFEFRRQRAWQLAGMKKNPVGRICAVLFTEKMYEHDEEDYLVDWIYSVLSNYLRFCNATMYETWFSLKVNFYQVTSLLRSPLGRDKDGNSETAAVRRTDLQKSIVEMSSMILSLEGTLFSGIKEISDAMNESELEKALAGYAEYNADSLEADLQRNLGK